MRSGVRVASGLLPVCAAALALLFLGAGSASASSAAPGFVTLGLGGWQVQSSATASQPGGLISTPAFDRTAAGWLQVKPDDAGAPGTEIEALLQSGVCRSGPATPPPGDAVPNVFFSTNMESCFGYSGHVGPVVVPQFEVPWWFRTDFSAPLGSDQHATLLVNGVVGQADVWINGREVATQATVQGDFTRYSFDVSGLVNRGSTNTLALEVYPNDPTSMYTLDDVDWNQIPPDNNTGIQFPVQLHVTNALGLTDAHVLENNASDMSSSALTVKADVTNYTSTSQTGTVTATVTAPAAGSPFVTASQPVTVPAKTTQTVTFTSTAYPALTVNKPQLWWPYQMGSQPLYTLSVTLGQGASTPETSTQTFGIRTITTSLIGANGPMGSEPSGSRIFAINGVPFVFRGGGFAENLFLHYSAADTANQIMVMKSLGVNGIRTEGKQLPDDFYEQMDRAGILVDGGFQCCDFWQFTKSLTQQNLNVIQNSALAIGQNLRDHPSVINFSWSDNPPSTQQEQAALPGFEQADFYPQDPLISSAEYKTDPLGVLGPSGEKEGPYDWVPPNYWYDTTHFNPGDSSRTNVGGSWGFDSETSPGDTVPTLDSIRRFMGAGEQSDLWQNPGAKQYHTNYESGATTGYHFGSLQPLDTAITNRYGPWSSLAQYVEEAQVQNYEDARAEFEAYVDHSTNPLAPSTGIVYWQMNKGWPTLLWDLYNSDYDEAGSYFGAKKANENLHALYALDTGSVTVDNLGGTAQSGLSVTANVYDLAGNRLDHQTVSNISLASQQVLGGVITPKNIPAATAPPTPAQTYFVEVLLAKNGSVVDRNVYWLSTQQDVVDWTKTIGAPKSTLSQYADLTALQGLPQAKLSVTATSGGGTTSVTITNASKTSTVAFFLRADVRRGDRLGQPQSGDNQVLPISWSDNDITLWPGESQTLTATYDPSLLYGATPVVSVFGWNVPEIDVAAG